MSARSTVVNMPPRPDGVAASGHRPKKVFESGQAVIFDDFLPEDVYQRLYRHALMCDYEHINTRGRVSRSWHLHDGFPLRSSPDFFYFADESSKPDTGYVYPTGTELDLFTDHLLAVQPSVEHLVGRKGTGGWELLSVTGWIYPPATGLSMHTDGGAYYTGAFVYFLSPVWRSYWGGMLLLADEELNRAVADYRATQDGEDFYRLKWLNANHAEEQMMEHGLAKCIFPKRNRLVFLDSEAYHMVTRVNEAAGDNPRMSLAGFFHKQNPLTARDRAGEGTLATPPRPE